MAKSAQRCCLLAASAMPALIRRHGLIEGASTVVDPSLDGLWKEAA